MINRTKLPHRMLLLSICLTCVSALAEKPLPVDSRILTGVCDNGVKWMYRQHDNPPGKMGLMIHVRSGSLNEKDDQRGLAHFIEHMCFNGTEHFAPGTLIPYFESIGMEFGADLNAFTSFDETAYMLFTPDASTDQIDKALMVLSDYAFRATLSDEEIDKERGVVLEEMRRGKSAFQRIRDKLWPELFEGSRFAERIPIGDENVLRTAKRDVFTDYYRSWYRPENVTVVLVGDAPSEAYVPLIKKWFGEYKPDVQARKPMGPEFKPFTKERAIVVTDSELSRCVIQLTNILPGRPPTVSFEQARTELVEHIGGWIIGRRFDDRVKKGDASFRGAGAGVDNFFNDALLVTVSATGEPADWRKMLDEVIVEVNRAREFGFTTREFELAKKEILADAEHAVKTEPTQNARRLINGIVSSVNEKTPFLSAQQELDVYNELLPSITIEEVSNVFKTQFAPGAFAFVVQIPEKEGIVVPARQEVLAAVSEAMAKKPEPLLATEAPTDLLAKEPTPRPVTEKSFDADLGITSAWLENDVRVHHRFMDYKKDTVMVSIALAGGEIEEAAENVGVTQVASLAINEAATSRLTSSNIRDIMTGKNISMSGGGAGDALVIRLTGAPEDLEIGLRAVHAVLTDGKIEESAFKNWKLATLQQIDMMQKMPQLKAFEALGDLLTGGDPRKSFLTKENVEALSLEKAQAWFDRLRKESPIEVAVVGEMKIEGVMPLIEKYLGSLNKRPRMADAIDKLRKFARSTGPLAKKVDVETVTPQAMAIGGFVGCEGKNPTDRRALEIASNILTSRMVKRIREELSLVYSIRCSSAASWIYEDAGRFWAGATCDPGNADKVVEEVHKLLGAFAETGPTAEELDNAKKQIENNFDTSMREPQYWWDILRHYDLHHRNLADEKAERAAFAPYTGEQVQQVFKKYYTPQREFRVTSIPTKPATTAQPKDAATPPS